MTMQHKVIVSNIQPIESGNIPVAIFWINPSSGQVYISIGSWTPIISTQAIITYTLGTFQRTLYDQENEPEIPLLGDLWLQTSTQEMRIYLNDWTIYFAN